MRVVLAQKNTDTWGVLAQKDKDTDIKSNIASSALDQTVNLLTLKNFCVSLKFYTIKIICVYTVMFLNII